MIDITKINTLVELERLGWEYIPSGPDEIKCRCPVHEDQIPSVSINIKKNVFICHASHCNIKGDIIALLALIAQVERKTILVDLFERYPNLEGIKEINQDRIEEYHQAIWNSGPFLQELYKRGIIDEEIRKQKIGYSQREKRIMIPIFDINGRVINIRKYKPGAPGPDKMKNLKGYKTRALYLPEQLKYPTIWICGGELKALVSLRFLNPSNIGAVSFTGGEGAWDEILNSDFKNKMIFICMDVDAGGQEGTRRIAAQVNTTAQTVFIINLPLDKEKYPKGDINDWVGQEKAGEADFAMAMKLAIRYIPPYYQEQEDTNAEIIDCDLLEARKSINVNKKCRCNFIINMLDTNSYLVPKDIQVSCTRDQSFCPSCIINSKKVNEETGYVNITLKPTNQEFLNLIGISQTGKGIHFALLNALGIPDCKSAKIKVDTQYNAFDVRLNTVLDLNSNKSKTDINQPAYIVGIAEEDIELNIPYIGICRNYPDPKYSQSIFLINEIERQKDSLSSFSLNEEDYKLLKIFQI